MHASDLSAIEQSHSPLHQMAPGYLTATLSAIINGHKQSQIDGLLPWNSASA
jgi:hypothetical protein